MKDPGTFTILCTIGDVYVGRALCDLGASNNLMPLCVFKKLGIGAARPTTITLQLADRSICYPQGKIEDVLVRVDKFVFPADFIIMDFTVDEDTLILLGKPFLSTRRTLIDVEKGEMTMRVNTQEVTFNVLKAMKYPHEEVEDVPLIQCWDSLVQKQFIKDNDHLKGELALLEGKELIKEGILGGTTPKPIKPHWVDKYEALEISSDVTNVNIPSVVKPPTLELKQLPSHLKYAFSRDKPAFTSNCFY
ncbi:hypothetical protein A2U01_0017247 [Trifolium medium]|uniref:Aspartic peptidase DDI1-type domain-containing protein n=1 Tax=Trifolium medium TaxID=97028 RepID=A0A392N9H2_9FABA|nr:hypothetical protein [Trifolium medium]